MRVYIFHWELNIDYLIPQKLPLTLIEIQTGDYLGKMILKDLKTTIIDKFNKIFTF